MNGARLRVALAVGTAVWAVLLMLLFPEVEGLSRGYGGAILGLELATEPAHVAPIAGPDAATARAALDRGHAFDMAFPFFYGGLLCALLWPFGHASTPLHRWTARTGMAAALLTIPTDIRENLVLLDLTSELGRGGSGADVLAALPLATWSKWACLAVALGAVGVTGIREHRVLGGAALLAAASIALLGITGAPAFSVAMSLGLVAFYASAVAVTLRALIRTRATP
ncbi:MAG: hypothetical protein H6737_31135 [Alphaproteobacteria bacterium]|nr:hypothetical protein [Alphaproteobacteria bacterium]